MHKTGRKGAISDITRSVFLSNGLAFSHKSRGLDACKHLLFTPAEGIFLHFMADSLEIPDVPLPLARHFHSVLILNAMAAH